MCVIVSEESDVAAFKDYSGEAESASAPAAAPAGGGAAPAAAAETYPPHAESMYDSSPPAF